MARILIVEDDAENRLLMQTMITKMGHEVHAVGDGVRALEALGVDPGDLATHPDLPAEDQARDDGTPAPGGSWDLVLMDVVVPGPDGCDTCRRIRAQGLAVPVVAVTGLAMSGDRETCLEAGMNDYVAKPFTVEVVKDVLDRWL